MVGNSAFAHPALVVVSPRWWPSPCLVVSHPCAVAGTLTKFTLVLYGTATDSPSLSNQLESSGCKTLTPSQTCVGECGAGGEGVGTQDVGSLLACTDPVLSLSL